jgi:hypothetical protein
MTHCSPAAGSGYSQTGGELYPEKKSFVDGRQSTGVTLDVGNSPASDLPPSPKALRWAGRSLISGLFTILTRMVENGRKFKRSFYYQIRRLACKVGFRR